MTQALSPTAFGALLPLLLLALGAAANLLLSVAGGERKLAPPGGVHLLLCTLLSLASAAWALWAAVPPAGPGVAALQGALVFDGLGLWFGAVACLGTAISAVLALPVLVAQGMATGEYFALLLLSCAGAISVGMAGDLLTLFLAVELLSVPAYVLAGFRRSSKRSQEAALKYFLYGAFASAFIVFGLALVWGESGRTSGQPTLLFHQLAHLARLGAFNVLGRAGLLMVVAGLAFKVAAAPFHMWAPDVYEGSPTPSAGFLSVVVKMAGFAGLVRFAASAFAASGEGAGHAQAVQLFVGLAAASVIVGNVLALRQRQIKRMLACSSIAQAGYVLVGVVALIERPEGGAAAAIGYYLLAYVGMGLGAFAVVSALEGAQEPRHDFDLERLAGAGRRAPGLGFAAAVLLLGLAGIPPSFGFFGKAALFASAVSAGHVPLVVLAGLCSVVGAYSYLRVLAVMFMRRPSDDAHMLRSAWLQLGLALCAGLTLGFGLLPELPFALARATLSGWWLGI